MKIKMHLFFSSLFRQFLWVPSLPSPPPCSLTTKPYLRPLIIFILSHFSNHLLSSSPRHFLLIYSDCLSPLPFLHLPLFWSFFDVIFPLGSDYTCLFISTVMDFSPSTSPVPGQAACSQWCASSSPKWPFLRGVVIRLSSGPASGNAL
jgi:hypothetical protein